jgi:hypothetical protein
VYVQDAGYLFNKEEFALQAGADPGECKKYNSQGSDWLNGALSDCKFVAEHKGVNPEKLKELRKQQKAVPSTTVQ